MKHKYTVIFKLDEINYHQKRKKLSLMRWRVKKMLKDEKFNIYENLKTLPSKLEFLLNLTHDDMTNGYTHENLKEYIFYLWVEGRFSETVDNIFYNR